MRKPSLVGVGLVGDVAVFASILSNIGDGGDFRVHEAAKVAPGVMNFNKARPVVTNARF